MFICRRDGGLLVEKGTSFSTLTSHAHGANARVTRRCNMLLGENTTKRGLNASSLFDDSTCNRNSSKRNGAPWHLYFSSAAIHSNDSIANLKKSIQLLLNEDVLGDTKTKSEIEKKRNAFEAVLLSLRDVDERWAFDASIKLLEKMLEWNDAGYRQLHPFKCEFRRCMENEGTV